MSGDTAAVKAPSDTNDAASAGAEDIKPAKKARRPSAKAAAKIVEQRIGHTFADPALLATAFTHVSALKSARSRADSYQRLEFLGDHVLGLIVSDMLYRAFPKADEGELSKRLADLVRREACADVAKSLGLDEAIKLGSVGAGASARLRNSVLGDICEAVIG
ncbi:MAG TPA: ribonuclease III domain-containing protein, partial [Afipia sp.]